MTKFITAAEIVVGLKYQANNKRKDICTVIDIYKTYNIAGELVATRYICEYEFLGQRIKSEEVAVTIQRAVARDGCK